MIADLNERAGAELPEYDLCIIGSGPAGATVAAELARREAADLRARERAPAADAPRRRAARVESEGIHIKDYSRERVLGGASTTWAGLSSPLDAIDLGRRPWLRHSGWPIAQRRADPLLRARPPRATASRREALFGAGGLRRPARRGRPGAELGAARGEGLPGLQRAAGLRARGARDLRARRGRPVPRRDACMRLEREPLAPRVAAAVVRTRGGRECRLRARAFVARDGRPRERAPAA